MRSNGVVSGVIDVMYHDAPLRMYSPSLTAFSISCGSVKFLFSANKWS